MERVFGVTVSILHYLQPAIAVSKNPEHHSRMKHIDVRYHWLREKVENGLIKLQFVPWWLMCSQKHL